MCTLSGIKCLVVVNEMGPIKHSFFKNQLLSTNKCLAFSEEEKKTNSDDMNMLYRVKEISFFGF